MILRIHTSKNAAATKHYFVGRKSIEVYYSGDGQEFAGFWGGEVAKMLGLEGRFTDKAFAKLVYNQHPLNGEKLTQRMREDRRPGFDLNFNVPKSVSLAYAYTKDERIIRALRETHWEILQRMEKRAATRVRSHGRNEDRVTGKLVWAEIIHLTSRPENGYPDPHLHSHVYVFNVTWDDVEKKFKALQMGLIHDEADFYNRAATLLLADKLKALGLEIIPTEKSFEIAGIEPELNRKFSRRTQTIEAYAEKYGITDPAQKAKLAALTRQGKAKAMLIPELEPIWWANLLPKEREALEGIKALLKRTRAMEMSEQMALGAVVPDQSSHFLGTRKTLPESGEHLPASDFLGTQHRVTGGAGRRQSFNQRTKPRLSINDLIEATGHDYRAVALAIEHVFERASVVTREQLIAEASRNWCVGKATLQGIEKAVDEAPLLRREVDGRTFVTTEAVLAEEQRIARSCLEGKANSSH